MSRGCTQRECQDIAERLACVLESLPRAQAVSFGLEFQNLVDQKRRDIRAAASAALAAVSRVRAAQGGPTPACVPASVGGTPREAPSPDVAPGASRV